MARIILWLVCFLFSNPAADNIALKIAQYYVQFNLEKKKDLGELIRLHFEMDLHMYK